MAEMIVGVGIAVLMLGALWLIERKCGPIRFPPR